MLIMMITMFANNVVRIVLHARQLVAQNVKLSMKSKIKSNIY